MRKAGPRRNGNFTARGKRIGTRPLLYDIKRERDRLSRFAVWRQWRESLRFSQTVLARVQEVTQVASYELDVSGGIHCQSTAAICRVLGLKPSNGTFRLPADLTRLAHPEDRTRVREAMKRAIDAGERHDIEYRIVWPDGSTRYVRNIAEPTVGPDKKVTKVAGLLMDVTQRKQLEREILEISEREQNRFGQDLHDGLCQYLAAIQFRLLSLKQKLNGNARELSNEINNVAKLIRRAVGQTRTMAHGLWPGMSEPDSLMNALEALANGTQQAFGISCYFHCPSPVWIHDKNAAGHLYRIAQEAVHNSIRHGKATAVSITLLVDDGRLELEVRDKGVGFRRKRRSKQGMGLRVMQYRAGMVGGTLTIRSKAKEGTLVICSVQSSASWLKPIEFASQD